MAIQLINNGISQNEVIFSYPRRAAQGALVTRGLRDPLVNQYNAVSVRPLLTAAELLACLILVPDNLFRTRYERCHRIIQWLFGRHASYMAVSPSIMTSHIPSNSIQLVQSLALSALCLFKRTNRNGPPLA
ncbi:Uncharacterized protein HZ326_23452 [Fusarium oxysporum f. sp. albedinis]|nr:Uncharacterized protein HZ326_23452 [Fusarium oxysporum f. sp. albedinis]